MKTHAIILIALMAIMGIAEAITPKMDGFLIPASQECFVTVTLTGTVSQLNVMGNGAIAYDKSGRISKIGSSSISYDDTGRIKKIGTSVFKYDDTGRIKKIASAAISYSDTGRIKKIGVASISYDDEGRVDGINPGIASSI